MCDKIYKHNKMSSIAVFSATFMIIAAIFLFLSVKNVRAEDEKTIRMYILIKIQDMKLLLKMMQHLCQRMIMKHCLDL